MGEARCIGINTENTAALTFCVNVRVRSIVALGLRLGLDGPAPSPGTGAPRVPSPISSAIFLDSLDLGISETNDEKSVN
jgi:hypothetical protein